MNKPNIFYGHSVLYPFLVKQMLNTHYITTKLMEQSGVHTEKSDFQQVPMFIDNGLNSALCNCSVKSC